MRAENTVWKSGKGVCNAREQWRVLQDRVLAGRCYGEWLKAVEDTGCYGVQCGCIHQGTASEPWEQPAMLSTVFPACTAIAGCLAFRQKSEQLMLRHKVMSVFMRL